MIQNDSYLVHHGILGQKWGKKNGPPYPLDYNKLSPEERDKAKKSAIERGDVKEAYANRKHFSNQEIDDVIKRFNLEQRLADVSAEKVKTGMDKLNELSKNMNTISDAINKGSNLYNNTAKVLNAFGGKNLPIIGESKPKENEKSKKKQTIIEDYDDDGFLKKRTTTVNVDGNIHTKNQTFSKKEESKSETVKEPKKEKSSTRDEDIKKWAKLAEDQAKQGGSLNDAFERVAKYKNVKVSAHDLADASDYIMINGEMVKKK